MSGLTESSAPPSRPVTRPIVGVLALAVAILGLLASVVGPEIARAIHPAPRLEERVADLAVNLRDAVVAKWKDRHAALPPVAEPAHDWHQTLRRSALGLGAMGLILAAISYVRGERRPYAISAAGLAFTAIAWQGLMLLLGVVLVLMVLSLLLNGAGFDLSF